MSFIYPRTISVLRMPVSTDIDDTAYEGRVPPLTVILTGLSASIQQKSTTSSAKEKFPQDASNETYWRIFIRKPPRGVIKIRDVIVDDLGYKFEVVGDYWNSLGYNVLAKRLST